MTTNAAPTGTTTTTTTSATSSATADADGGSVGTSGATPTGARVRALTQQTRVRLAAVEQLHAEHRVIDEQSRRRLADSRRLLARSHRT